MHQVHLPLSLLQLTKAAAAAEHAAVLPSNTIGAVVTVVAVVAVGLRALERAGACSADGGAVFVLKFWCAWDGTKRGLHRVVVLRCLVKRRRVR